VQVALCGFFVKFVNFVHCYLLFPTHEVPFFVYFVISVGMGSSIDVYEIRNNEGYEVRSAYPSLPAFGDRLGPSMTTDRISSTCVCN
jgi:hypothetical protein